MNRNRALRIQVTERKPEEAFRVVDRRLFTAEGDLRQEAVEEERRREAAEPKQAPAAASPVPGKPFDQPQGKPFVEPQDKPQKTPTRGAPPPSPVFKNLLAFLARNAELIMAGILDPRSGRTVVDVESLRQIIDMMEELKEKTDGNLAQEDLTLLTEVIGDLKLSFVQLQQAALNQQAAYGGQGAGRKP